MKKIDISILKNLNKDWRMLVLAAVLSFGFVGFLHLFDRSSESMAAENIDTLIPAGFILIPIEAQNYESLDSLLGKFGVVDLFKSGAKNGRPIARNIRILRAPNNPSHFAVLAPENQAGPILANDGSFYVALKGPNQTGTQIENQFGRASRIHFDGE